MVTIIAIRHAHSLGNKFGFRQGQVDFPLSKKGIDQAQQLSKDVFNHSIDDVYTSDLRRASETVEFSEFPQGHELERLREIDFGRLSGTIYDIDDPDLPYSVEGYPGYTEKWPGGESTIEFSDRIKQAMQLVSRESDEEDTILIITHQGVLMGLRDIARSNKLFTGEYNELNQLEGVEFNLSYNTTNGGIDLTEVGLVNHN